MRAVIQRVIQASCKVNGTLSGSIQAGLLVFLGIEEQDSQEELEWLCRKIANMRIFSDSEGLMNRSIKEIKGDILLISQFTLLANTKKGNRPSFIRAAKPEVAVPLYQQAILCLETELGKKVETGIFGADMKIELINDGPVTIMMNSKDRENY